MNTAEDICRKLSSRTGMCDPTLCKDHARFYAAGRCPKRGLVLYNTSNREFHATLPLAEVLKNNGNVNPIGRTFTFKEVVNGVAYLYYGVPAVVDGDTVSFYAPGPWTVELEPA